MISEAYTIYVILYDKIKSIHTALTLVGYLFMKLLIQKISFRYYD